MFVDEIWKYRQNSLLCCRLRKDRVQFSSVPHRLAILPRSPSRKDKKLLLPRLSTLLTLLFLVTFAVAGRPWQALRTLWFRSPMKFVISIHFLLSACGTPCGQLFSCAVVICMAVSLTFLVRPYVFLLKNELFLGQLGRGTRRQKRKKCSIESSTEGVPQLSRQLR